MKKYDYLIIGGGMTADAAAGGIRKLDPIGSIGLISAEPDAPYDRPPLTKGLWKDKDIESIWRKTAEKGVEMNLSHEIIRLDPKQKQVTDKKGEVFAYGKLLLATGGKPRLLPFGGDSILYYRTVADYRKLRAETKTAREFAVIGGGFIGSEITAALALNGKKVTMIFPGKAIGDRMFQSDLARFISDYYQKKGVELIPGAKVTGMEKEGTKFKLKTDGSREVIVDAVVAGLGIEPNIELAKSAGLKVDNGIVVDEFLRTSDPDIYAAGDAAIFFNPSLGKRIRVEHEDNANTAGDLAGRNMAGKPEPYNHLPFFYSDLFDLGYEAVGDTDSRLETFADWKEPNKEGVIYYLKEGRVRGVMLWNVWGQVDAARQLIAAPGPFDAGNLKGRIH
jgi:NADPH-dependent 2,4-dienoyl-CoA reductase/sulfur reductase-like enzyme